MLVCYSYVTLLCRWCYCLLSIPTGSPFLISFSADTEKTLTAENEFLHPKISLEKCHTQLLKNSLPCPQLQSKEYCNSVPLKRSKERRRWDNEKQTVLLSIWKPLESWAPPGVLFLPHTKVHFLVIFPKAQSYWSRSCSRSSHNWNPHNWGYAFIHLNTQIYNDTLVLPKEWIPQNPSFTQTRGKVHPGSLSRTWLWFRPWKMWRQHLTDRHYLFRYLRSHKPFLRIPVRCPEALVGASSLYKPGL